MDIEHPQNGLLDKKIEEETSKLLRPEETRHGGKGVRNKRKVGRRATSENRWMGMKDKLT